MIPDLAALIDAQLPDLVRLRRDLHRHPELSYNEERTSAVIQAQLAAIGVEFRAGLARGTGILAHLPATPGARPEAPAVALRADMDALPITEETGREYASAFPGVMHACGHDGHTTMLIGAARILAGLTYRPNPITFIFQPAEEGGGGADLMCREGAMRGREGGGLGPPVGRIFGLHGWPQLRLGTVATRPGPLLASTDDFEVEVRGVGGHAAYPHLCRDPILAASGAIVALQSLASRAVGPLESIVCTVGQINAGTANNIIPGSARFIGTIRTLKPETRALARERFFEIIGGAVRSMGCEARIDWHEGYPVTRNDPQLTDRFLRLAADHLGESRVGRLEHPTMGGEDFAYYGHFAPACFFFLGLCPAGSDACPTLHQPDFDFNDDAIPTGVALLARLALME